MNSWRNISLWMDQLDDPLQARPSLQAQLHADVAIIGAGYTGLWTAYYLKRQAPQLRGDRRGRDRRLRCVRAQWWLVDG